MTKKKTILEAFDNIGNKIKGFGTVVSVMGATVLSTAVIIKYFTKKKEPTNRETDLPE